MTAVAESGVDAPDLAAELQGEATDLAARLGLGAVRTPGASGLLDPLARGSVWVHGPADLPALLAELRALPVLPDLMLLEGLPALDVALQAAGWQPGHRRVRVRRDLAGAAALPPGSAVVDAGVADLPEVRALHDAAFGPAPEDELLPDEVLAVPGLRLLLLRDAAGGLVGSVGLRTRRSGMLLFGLAVAGTARHRGAGSGLVAAAVAQAHAAGAPDVVAETDPEHRAFWDRAGFSASDAWRRWSCPRA